METARSRKTKGELDADTKRYYRNGWRLLESTQLAAMKLSEIGRDDVEALKFSGGPYNGNCALRTLRRMLNRAHELGLTSRPDAFSLMPEISRERTLTRAEETRFLMVAKQPLHDVVVCILDSGMRPEEIFRMGWEHVCWEQREYFIPFGKTNKSRRHVPISQRMYDNLIARWHAAGKPQTGWVFPCRVTKAGNPISPTGHITTVEKQFLAARAAAQLPKEVVLYTSRHTFGTRAYKGSRNLKAVMDVMGHADIKTTMRYQHPEVDLVRDAIEQQHNDTKHVTAQ